MIVLSDFLNFCGSFIYKFTISEFDQLIFIIDFTNYRKLLKIF